MNFIKLTIVLISVVFSSNVLAYGSGGSKKACSKPKFTEFTPPKLTAVTPQSNFSFKASSLTDPNSIEVSIKKQTIDVTIDKKGRSYYVSGAIPASIKGNYARIVITAKGTNNCAGSDGWLLKIETN